MLVGCSDTASKQASKDMADYLQDQENQAPVRTATTTPYLPDVLNNHDGSAFNATVGSIPFSFKYGNRAFSEDWTYLGPSADGSSWSWRDPTNTLEVKIEMLLYPKFGAVKWFLTFTNVGFAVSNVINTLDVANLGFITARGAVEQHVLDFSIGAMEEGASERNVLSDFTPVKVPIGANGGPVDLTSSRGRSSSGTMPYFHIQKPGQDGLIAAIGWSGQWKASFRVDGTGTNMGFRAGQETFRAQLRPGESVRTPSILLMPYTGTARVTGQNKFRSMMIEHFYPRNSDGSELTPVAAASNGALGIAWENVTADNLLDEVDGVAASKIPFNTIWLDAGWYKTLSRAQDTPLYDRLAAANLLWFSGAGDWTHDPVRFPDGYALVSERAQSFGMRSLLWFEPERVAKPSLAYTDFAARNRLLAYPTTRPSGDFVGDETVKQLVNFSDGSVVDEMINKITQRLTANRIDIFRQDMNINSILEYWVHNDARQSAAMGGIARAGLTEARYISGLYRFWDGLRANIPGLVIDNCASGGRRLDFEALERTVALWRSDRVWEPNEQQDEMLGLSYWLPYQGRGSENSGDVPQLLYKIRSGHGWSAGYAFNWINLAPAHRDLLRREIGALFGKTSPLGPAMPFTEIFKGDFYPMAHAEKRYNSAATIPDYTRDMNVWAGWQFDRSDMNVGLVQVFKRSNGAAPSMTYRPQGLAPDFDYEVRDMDSSLFWVKKGSELMSTGFPVTCAADSCARIFTYKKIFP